jgi:hypothetical protein
MTRTSHLATVALTLATIGPALAQVPAPRVESVAVHAHRLEHQPVREAVSLIEPFLSSVGSFEVRADTNTLVVRDLASVVETVRALLVDFDHLPLGVELHLYVLDASRRGVEESEQAPDSLPEALREGLGEMLRFNRYVLVGSGQVTALEGEEVSYQVAPEYGLSFTVGTVLGGQRLKLRSFEVARRDAGGEQRLAHLHLNLEVGRLLVLGLARESSAERSLVVAVRAGVPSLQPVRLGGTP